MTDYSRPKTDVYVDELRALANLDDDKRPGRPDAFNGSAGDMERNARRFADYWMASTFVDALDGDRYANPAEAAAGTLKYARAHLLTLAARPPRSSDWLALPRWAAEVSGVANALGETWGGRTGAMLNEIATSMTLTGESFVG